MSFYTRYFLLFLILSVTVILTLPDRVYTQNIGVRVSFQNVAKKKSSTRVTRRSRNTRVRRQVIVKTKEIVRNVKTSNLTVSSEPGARIAIKGQVGREIFKTVPKNATDDRTIEFENLRPGKYKVSVTLEGFETQETEVVVPRQKTVGITMDLEPVTYDLVIETNIKEGEIRYAPAKYQGKNTDGTIITKESGGYCIVLIENGEAVISELKQGYYNIDVRPEDIAYQPVLTAINVPTEILADSNDDGKDEFQSYAIDLEKKISTETFSSAWTKNDWILPAGWELVSRTMKNNGTAGIALPQNEQYRFYTDFELISDVISSDGRTVGFALRAADSKNYYLLQISGANSGEPFLATGAVVKDGVATPLFSVPIEHFAKTIAKNKPFRVVIKGEKNVFKIYIEDSATAQRLEVGNMIDRDGLYQKGAIGIVGSINSGFVAGSFTVCSNTCR